MNRLVTTIIGSVLLFLVVIALGFSSPKINAFDVKPDSSKWENIHFQVQEQRKMDDKDITITWDYWRNEEGYWRKEITNIKGVQNPDQQIGYFLIFNGKQTLEYIPFSNTLLITEHKEDVVYEADYILQPQRIEKILISINNGNVALTSSDEIDNVAYMKVEIEQDESNREYYWIDDTNNFIKRYQLLDQAGNVQKEVRILNASHVTLDTEMLYPQQHEYSHIEYLE